ncbi:Rz1-like lysis system protein LysC [Yersinia pseudotuberculosis]|uniref:Rz1-like lysis system protein LysC n=1 Tax=Yersinia pseudotuberculosis TaxID=633 RepID=UPI0009B5B069
MSGCSTPVRPVLNVLYQQNLLTPCPEILPRLSGNTGADFSDTLDRYKTIYTECAARHNQLIFEIKQRQELTK